jgi:hypothetical protein
MDENIVMPVAPYNSNGNNGFGGFFGGDASWIIIFLFLAMFGGGWGGFGGFGGGMWGMDGMFPWLLASGNNTNNVVSSGFDHAATQSALSGLQSSVTSVFGDVQTALCNGFGNVQTSLCSGFAGVNSGIAAAQNAITQQMYTNQIADMERSFNAQTASTQGMNALQSQLATCCCENRAATADVKYTIANEACATRANSTANTQAILDKLCQLELDNAKSQIAAEQRENANLRTELMYARGQASQIEQTAQILQGQNQEVDALYNRLNNCPVSTVPVYGKQPIFQCGGNTGCGCGM